MTTTTGYTVGQAAVLAGVTVRTLHHYDEIGLLAPSGRTAAGYRTYSDDDLERLHQILSYRELGLPLDQIAALLDDPRTDAVAHLQRQHELLTERIAQLQRMVAAVEHAMEAHQMGIRLTPEERFELFGDFLPEDYEQEVKDRWGDTDAYRQSQRRTASYTKDDWVAIKAESSAIEQDFAAALRDGIAPDSPEAMDAAERHRQHISRWFYDCGYDVHRGLGEMYTTDERFTAYYEAIAPGLAAYVRDAVVANAERAGG